MTIPDPEERLSLPPAADADETAAVVAAIRTVLADEAAAAGSESTRPWADRRWSYAGRLATLERRPVRIPTGAPPDPWSTAGRVDRL